MFISTISKIIVTKHHSNHDGSLTKVDDHYVAWGTWQQATGRFSLSFAEATGLKLFDNCQLIAQFCATFPSDWTTMLF